jgi:hypothetical protein
VLDACVELGGRDRLTGLEPIDAAHAGDVEHHPAADDALADHRHVLLHGAGAQHDFTRDAPVVRQSVIGDVAQRVDVRVAVAVRRHPKPVQPEPHLAAVDRDVMGLGDEARGRVGVVRAGQGVDRDRHRHAAPRAHERRGVPHALRSDQVERPQLVVRAPAAPVLDRLEDLLEVGNAQLAVDRVGHW